MNARPTLSARALRSAARAPWAAVLTLLLAACGAADEGDALDADESASTAETNELVEGKTHLLPGKIQAEDYALGGEEVFGYHMVNLLIHVATALGLYGLTKRTLERSIPIPNATVATMMSTCSPTNAS